MSNAKRVQRLIVEAKSLVFRMQDIAAEIGDAELRLRLQGARDELESADRRTIDLEQRTLDGPVSNIEGGG
jgi:hypothetical protein